MGHFATVNPGDTEGVEVVNVAAEGMFSAILLVLGLVIDTVTGVDNTLGGVHDVVVCVFYV